MLEEAHSRRKIKDQGLRAEANTLSFAATRDGGQDEAGSV